MNLFNSIVMKTIPYLPKWFATPFAKPYVAGETAQEGRGRDAVRRFVIATTEKLPSSYLENQTDLVGLVQDIEDSEDCF